MTTTGNGAERETVRLLLLPLPAEEMDSAGAREWLTEDARRWVSMLGDALLEEDEPTREAFAVLALDVERVMAAAARALDGESVAFAVDGEAEGGGGFESTVASLARMASAQPAGEDPGVHWSRCQAALRGELLRRLDRIGAGEGGEPRAAGR